MNESVQIRWEGRWDAMWIALERPVVLPAEGEPAELAGQELRNGQG